MLERLSGVSFYQQSLDLESTIADCRLHLLDVVPTVKQIEFDQTAEDKKPSEAKLSKQKLHDPSAVARLVGSWTEANHHLVTLDLSNAGVALIYSDDSQNVTHLDWQLPAGLEHSVVACCIRDNAALPEVLSTNEGVCDLGGWTRTNYLY